jgi:uncharacterized protein (TIGR02452 family)
MQDIKDYWTDKEKRAEIAKVHTKEMEEKYSKEMKYSIKNIEICNSIDILKTEKEEPENTMVEAQIYVCDIDTVGAILEFASKDKRIAALNFASYKNAGGMFIKGSRAQEECLCHESFLYNVLKENESYYEANRKNKNRALYHNRALYSPDVIFEREGRLCYCDVITCAAPNKRAAQKYCNVSDEENSRVLESRIDFILDIAKMHKVDILVLGAFGCGVFGQSGEEVAKIFHKLLLREEYGCFESVVFAVPASKNGNFQSFYDCFSSEILEVKHNSR